jgi:hypothetical protein
MSEPHSPTTAWTPDELDAIAGADELEISSLRRDGTRRRPVTIWVVRHGDDLYVRSVGGPTGAWFRGTQTRNEGHVESGGVAKDVTFAHIGDDMADALDAAYRGKYRRYTASIVDQVTTPAARAATLQLVPRSTSG